MSEKNSEYEVEKQKKKQLLVRDEFKFHKKSCGEFEFPLIKKQVINIDEIEFLSFVNAKKGDTENSHKTIHFFTYDWKFEKVYSNPEEELEKLKQYKYVLSPDFSLFTNMPLALQIASVFKNRWCGAYWQSKGLKVIPTVSWGSEKTFEFCFDGIEEGSVVAVCTYYRENCEHEFMLGYNEMVKRIKPSAVICYDEPFKEMTGNVREFLPNTYEWTKNLSWKDLVQFKWEKKNRNVSGHNPNDFSYFEYKDPFAKTKIVKCSICGGVASEDEYGNGECRNCGWKFGKDQDLLEEKLGISYLMLVSPTTARKQYRAGQKFKATFDEFVSGLFFYSEMLFEHNNIMYEVFRKGEQKIVLCSKDMLQEFDSRESFVNGANIDGCLLKDLWDDVTFAGFMFCG